MPKPTFFQAVLRKPTRKYADPYAPSPWADYPVGLPFEDKCEDQSDPDGYQNGGNGYDGYEEEESDSEESIQPRKAKSTVSVASTRSRRQAPVDNHVAYVRDGAEKAGHSRPRRAGSTVSVVSDQQSTMSTKFPQPVKKAKSSVALRDGAIVRVTDDRDSRKKKVLVDGNAPGLPSRPAKPALTTSTTNPVPRRKTKQKSTEEEIAPRAASVNPPPPKTVKAPPIPQSESSSSKTSSIVSQAPTNHQAAISNARPPPTVTASPRPIPEQVVAPLTPPSSDRSSTPSSVAQQNIKFLAPSSLVRSSPVQIDSPTSPQSTKSTAGSTTSDEGAAFHTPRTSLDFSHAIAKPSQCEEAQALTPRAWQLAPALPSFQIQPFSPSASKTSSSVSKMDGSNSVTSSSMSASQPHSSAPTSFRSSTSASQPLSIVPSLFLSLGTPLASSTRIAQVELDLATKPRPTARPLAPPSFNFLPPTPAALVDPESSPFHSEPTSSSSLTSSLHPDRRSTVPLVPASGTVYASPTSQKVLSAAQAVQQNPTTATGDVDEVESASGVAGSDADEQPEPIGESAASRGRNRRQNSVSRPPSRTATSRDRSRPASVVQLGGLTSVDGRRPHSRQSTARQSVNKPYDDFVIHRHESMHGSEASFDGRSVREGSIRSSPSGYGKGGWAAAAASRSGATSPVMMYMPVEGNDGWAQFQQPPRQSRYTPLPLASQPVTFEKLLNGGNQSGLAPPLSKNNGRAPSASSPSEYSQTSDDDEGVLPRPSRSYAKKENGSEASQSHSASQSQSQSSEVSDHLHPNGSVPLPKNGYANARGNPSPIVACASAHAVVQYPGRPESSISRTVAQPVSRPMSPVSESRPASPSMQDGMPSRPSSRSGFDAPSFLNPDTLTLLPEMSLEDSARTYSKAKSESGRSRRSVQNGGPKRSNSLFGGIARSAKSESSYDEHDEVPELQARRAQSALGSWNGGGSQKWQGSSYDEGQLMESHGREGESGGYT